MILTQKVRIHPNHAVQQVLWEISALCRELWNLALEQRRNCLSWGRVNRYTQKKELPELKRAFPEFKKPASQVLQNVILDLDAAYQMFFSKRRQGDRQVRPPRFKSHRQFVRQRYSQRDTAFSIDGEGLHLAYGTRPADWLTIDLPAGNYDDVRTVEIIYDSGKWYACMTYRVKEKQLKRQGSVIYFDPGCKMALTGMKSNGEYVEYDLGPLREMNRSTYALLDDLISRRDRKQKGSPSWRRLNQRIRKLFGKIRTRTRMYLHKLANIILNDHPDVKAFYIGNWKKQETLADTPSPYVNRRINRAVQNNHPLEVLIEYLTYKGKLRGQAVKRFDERGSTRCCAACGHRHEKGIAPGIRVFVCEQCGFCYSRDHQSCLNFIKQYEPALWRRLSDSGTMAGIPDCSLRVGLNPFSFKPWRRKYILPAS